ncbi:MAG: flagellar biosynthesis protein FlhF [Aeoliella sp.]
MEIKTFRAKSMQQALALVRQELGPEASVLHTREVHAGLIGRLVGGRKVEVVASTSVNVPSRLEVGESKLTSIIPQVPVISQAHEECDYRAQYRADLGQEIASQIGSLHSMVEQLCTSAPPSNEREMPQAMFEAFTDLIEADVDEATARELVDSLPTEGLGNSPNGVRELLFQQVQRELATTGPIEITPGARRLVALVGPTGVGKTTTIAKLAANYRLLEKKRVGLITVDTYRVAAVEQLRTYADIIDLPMEVVATPREMREAVQRMEDLDLVLLDTAGRSPRDEVQIQELKSMLGESQADEVHLVLSSTAAPKSLLTTAQKFAEVGATSLLLTKLDEAMSLGHLLALLRNCRLPVSYLTNGQNVPDDIEVADAGRLAEALLGSTATV